MTDDETSHALATISDAIRYLDLAAQKAAASRRELESGDTESAYRHARQAAGVTEGALHHLESALKVVNGAPSREAKP